MKIIIIIFICIYQTFGIKPNISLCCGINEYYYNDKCINNKTYFLEYNIEPLVYDKNIKLTNKTIYDSFNIIINKLNDKTFKEKSYDVIINKKYINIYLIENGILYMENYPNSYNKWIKIDTEYCINYIKINNKLRLSYRNIINEKNDDNIFYLIKYNIVSCVFIILTLILYSLLYNNRIKYNVYDLELFSLFMFQYLITILNIDTHYELVCKILTYLICFFAYMLFSCINITSIVILSNLYNIKINKKYCNLYIVFLPIIIISIFILFDNIDMTNYSWIITPKTNTRSCFLGYYERLFYLYIPIGLMILLNWIIFSIIIFKMFKNNNYIWKWSNILLYLKLSVIMGLMWIFEIISSFFDYNIIFYIIDIYNCMSGFSLFIVLILNQKFIINLHKKNIYIKV
ncbi:hypothetical protein AMV261 [Betaentomopoxvirus amoorei]|uniref:AMV261 n=1 Tax=Amsacta moorei entomopoxvirus TaxID=28321 RepID=Q9EME5_AMEPV|nr:hypothetical protein AMV261 [Amsacta moorei entomopoxvirus]AAG02967.1 AMV261 [Amsacta moorei entomopoxvirus]